MILRIDTQLTKKQSEYIFNTLDDDELLYLESLNFDAYDEEIDGKVTSFIVIESYKLPKILQFLFDKEIKFSHTDLSECVLDGTVDFTGTKIEKSVKKYIEQNLTQDHVLDKINKSGLDSLNEFEKSFLI